MELFGQLIRRLFHKLGLENPDFLGRLGRVDNIFSQLISRNAGEFGKLIEILFDGLSGKDALQGLFELGGGLLGNVGQEGLLFLVVEEAELDRKVELASGASKNTCRLHVSLSRQLR